jgi:hypothetical protein
MQNNLLLGIVYGFIAQVLTFLQLQGNIKYDWYNKYPVLLLLASIPISWCYIQSVKFLVLAFNNEIWPSRLIGFAVGIFAFTLMSSLLFKEPITLKVVLSLILAFCILMVQIFIK